MTWAGVAIVFVSLAIIFYFVYSRSAPPVAQESQVVSPLSEELKRLEIKWNFLEDKRFQNLESSADASSLTIGEVGRNNPFEPTK